MNLTARRLATTAAGATLALSALAATGPAAHAAKPSPVPQPLTITFHDANTDPYGPDIFSVRYEAPVAPRAVKSVTCTLDSAPMDACGVLQGTETATYWATYMFPWFTAGEHTITYTVTTRKATYTGSVQFTGTGA